MRLLNCVIASCGLSSVAHAALVELRIVERTGQAVVDATDAQLDFAVQVRVNSNTLALGTVNFSLQIVGEAQTRGQLGFGRISRLDDRTYTPEIGGPAPGFESGVAAQYRFLVDLNSAFNGLINSSAAAWTQTPDQDIGLIQTRTGAARLLQTPGLDVDGDEHPDTAPPAATTAVIPDSIRREYFGMQNWIDLYRFRYRVTDLAPRPLDLRVIDDPRILSVFAATEEIRLVSGIWAQILPRVDRSDVSITNWTGTVIPAPGLGGLILVCAMVGTQRRR